MLKKLWDPNRSFFFHLGRDAETDGTHTVDPLTFTYQSGKFRGNKHGRELIGYVPWHFRFPMRERSQHGKP